MLDRLKEPSDIKDILKERLRERSRHNQRFFGEAFVATNVPHERGWYSSYKWLTAPKWTGVGALTKKEGEFRKALKASFPSLARLQRAALAMKPHLGGKKPVAPDLWLISGRHHHFIEVKLPRDAPRPTQTAGLALIAKFLRRDAYFTVSIYSLEQEGKRKAARAICRAAEREAAEREAFDRFFRMARSS